MTRAIRRAIKWVKWVDRIGQIAGDEEHSTHIQFGGPASMTPMGLIPVNEDNVPSKIYNMWVGHTSFSITQHIAEKIAAEPGVEGFDVFSRYRFRIVVGEQFAEEAVKKSIEMTLARSNGYEKVLNFLHNNATDEWAFVVLGNQSHCYHAASQQEVEFWLSNFSGLSATIFCSWSAYNHDEDCQNQEDGDQRDGSGGAR